jgi:hypothetical protein
LDKVKGLIYFNELIINVIVRAPDYNDSIQIIFHTLRVNLVLHVNEHKELDDIHESLSGHPDSDVARMLSLSNLTVKSLLVDRIFQAIRLAERSESQEI